jgi:MOSC domain-containing protein YiiM
MVRYTYTELHVKTMHTQNITELMQTFPRSGELAWIGVRPARGVPMQALTSVAAETNKGLRGDRYDGKSGKRQVTLIQWEHLAVLSALTGLSVHAAILRRNLAIKGINLLALKEQQFQIGEVLLQYTGLCQPCSKMESILGQGGYNAMRGHGGITAQIIQGGLMSVGDTLTVLS